MRYRYDIVVGKGRNETFTVPHNAYMGQFMTTDCFLPFKLKNRMGIKLMTGQWGRGKQNPLQTDYEFQIVADDIYQAAAGKTRRLG